MSKSEDKTKWISFLNRLGRSLVSLAAYLWGFALFLLVIALFFGLDSWSSLAAELPFMKIHPRYEGGPEVAESMQNGLIVQLHAPVFAGLLHDRSDGFVQVDLKFCEFENTENRGTGTQKNVSGMPHGIEPHICKIDYDLDGLTDFILILPSGKKEAPVLEVINPQVQGLGMWASVEDGWIIRINLSKN